MKCERCDVETKTYIMSMFNTQNICMRCKEKEQKHPAYKLAQEIELIAVNSGDRNFQGIGLPEELIYTKNKKEQK